jgi:polyisoprenoid-binding protein YceI
LELTGAARDAKGDLRIGFEAGVEIDRRDYGLTWNKALETGGFMVDNAVTITIDIEAIHDSATE